MSKINLIIWDSDANPSDTDGIVYCWRGNHESEHVFSLLQRTEKHADRLRNKYLAFIHELGTSLLSGQNIIDHLTISKNLSYWWLTPFVEKSPYKFPVNDALLLLSIEEVIIELNPTNIHLVSGNLLLGEAIGKLCGRLKINFQWNCDKKAAKFSTVLCNTPAFVIIHLLLRAAFKLIRYALKGWHLRKQKNENWFSGDKSVFFCSYFFLFDKTACSSGRFESQYWGSLPKLLYDSGFRMNWIHHYFKSDVVPNVQHAKKLICRFNIKKHEQGYHALLDSFISIKLLLRATWKWTKLMLKAISIRDVHTIFRPSGSMISFWPLMRKDWYSCVYGPLGISNILLVELFDALFKTLPTQDTGLYLYEEQPWEHALISAWKKYGHGRLIGVAHSTIRFWDFRYFHDKRMLKDSGCIKMPRPDRIAVNGPIALKLLREVGYQNDDLVAVEALRYMKLDKLVEKKKLRNVGQAKPNRRLLVLGDYMPDTTHSMMSLLNQLPRDVLNNWEITVKPHPCNKFFPDQYPDIQFVLTENSLDQILPSFEFVYGSNPTSANLDAYLSGSRVIIHLDSYRLNQSPLRGVKGVKFVKDSSDLYAALNSPHYEGNRIDQIYFWIDSEMPRWRRLFNIKQI